MSVTDCPRLVTAGEGGPTIGKKNADREMPCLLDLSAFGEPEAMILLTEF